jgi:hypothetical protein
MTLVATCTMLWAVSPNPWYREIDNLIFYITNTRYVLGGHLHDVVGRVAKSLES